MRGAFGAGVGSLSTWKPWRLLHLLCEYLFTVEIVFVWCNYYDSPLKALSRECFSPPYVWWSEALPARSRPQPSGGSPQASPRSERLRRPGGLDPRVALEVRRGEGREVPDELLAHVSPLNPRPPSVTFPPGPPPSPRPAGGAAPCQGICPGRPLRRIFPALGSRPPGRKRACRAQAPREGPMGCPCQLARRLPLAINLRLFPR